MHDASVSVSMIRGVAQYVVIARTNRSSHHRGEYTSVIRQDLGKCSGTRCKVEKSFQDFQAKEKRFRCSLVRIDFIRASGDKLLCLFERGGRDAAAGTTWLRTFF